LKRLILVEKVRIHFILSEQRGLIYPFIHRNITKQRDIRVLTFALRL